MPVDFELPDHLANARWKVKIREKETREPPHVTIIRGTEAWRINLRTRNFMDSRPNPKDVPQEIVDLVTEQANWNWICDQWDAKYPNNPVNDRDE